ncbi:MAG: hypothetical protein LC722_08630 [Actinobacteria bacterium]|nr:hypothetical protein [Actinomycetota bacterium]
MNRNERRLGRIHDEIQRLREEVNIIEAELATHRDLADEATRDAVVSDHPAQRAEARQADKVVARLEASLATARRRIDWLERKQDDLLERLRPAP